LSDDMVGMRHGIEMGGIMGKRKEFMWDNADVRRLKVGQMWLEGHVQYTIATILGIEQSTVSKDLDVVRQEWLERRLLTYDEKIAKECAGLEYQESELWKAWHRSCQLEVISTKTIKRQLRESGEVEQTTTKTKRKGKKTTTQDNGQTMMIVVADDERTVTRQMIGDPRFMAEITKVRELRCKLMGLLEDAKPDSPIINIWQQLQEMKFDRDRDPIEEAIQRVRQLPPVPTDDKGIKGHPLDRNEPLNGFVEHMENSDLEPGQHKDDTPLDVPDE
jgi:predicted transcriptional regulator